MNGPKDSENYDDPETEGWSDETHEDQYYSDEEDGTPDGDIGMNPAE